MQDAMFDKNTLSAVYTINVSVNFLRIYVHTVYFLPATPIEHDDQMGKIALSNVSVSQEPKQVLKNLKN